MVSRLENAQRLLNANVQLRTMLNVRPTGAFVQRERLVIGRWMATANAALEKDAHQAPVDVSTILDARFFTKNVTPSHAVRGSATRDWVIQQRHAKRRHLQGRSAVVAFLVRPTMTVFKVAHVPWDAEILATMEVYVPADFSVLKHPSAQGLIRDA